MSCVHCINYHYFILGTSNGTTTFHHTTNPTNPSFNYNNNPNAYNPNRNDHYDNNRGSTTTYRPFPSKCIEYINYRYTENI